MMMRGTDSELPATTGPFSPALGARARVAALRTQLMAREPTTAAVVGLGKSGRAAAALLRALGARLIVLDDQPVTERWDGVTYGPISAELLEQADLVVLSPGVPRLRPELARSIERGVLVGEIELASWALEVPLIGITGTNGKSTTTALTAHLLEADGMRVFAGGNLGRPLSELALEKVVDGTTVDVAVVELSSYQLESLVEASFLVAAWLNLSPDHTDRYASVGLYAEAKRRLIERRSIRGSAVLNALDPVVHAHGAELGGPIRWFAADASSSLAGALGTQGTAEGRATRVSEAGFEHYDLTNPALVGEHNRANMAAAIECARLAGASVEGVQAGLRTFAGLPHRIEHVGVARGARWYNDSKATNVDSAMTAARAVSGPKILIAGGRDKGAPWAPLVELLRGQLRAVLAVGEATPIVLSSFAGVAPVVEDVGTVERAVARAAQLAQPGDAVLLSPACASLDQFKNYEARGDLFRALVRQLHEEEKP
jgi:UDP-N-acetylmuramoylalanine--D-glutamate ligase